MATHRAPIKRTKSRFAVVLRIIKNHFIPHRGNGHHPHLLRHHVLVGYSAFLIALKLFTIGAAVFLPSYNAFSTSITSDSIIELTNKARQDLGLKILKPNHLLSQAARNKAEDMLTHQYFAHTSPEGKTPWYWINRAGYIYTHAAENLAVHYTTAEDVQQGWLASAGHRANIVNPRYDEIGIGVAQGTFEGSDSTIVVQMFGEAALGAPIQPPESVIMSAAAVLTEPEPRPVTPPPTTVTPSTPTTPSRETTPTPRIARAPTTSPRSPTQPQTRTAPPPTPTAVPTHAAAVTIASVRPRPQQTLEVVATSTNAQHVSVQLAGQTTPLTQQTSTTWSGSVAYDPQHFSLGGEQVYLTTTNASGTQDVETIAVAAPLATQEQVFAFQSPSQNVKKIFGLISVESFRDSVGRFYLYFMVFLFGMLVLNMLVRLDKQKHVVNLHVFGVILLAAVLSIL